MISRPESLGKIYVEPVKLTVWDRLEIVLSSPITIWILAFNINTALILLVHLGIN